MSLVSETQTVIKDYKFMGIPLIGDAMHLIDKAAGWLVCNWEGHVIWYSKKVPVKDWFDPTDKGGLSVFGLDNNGKVMFGMVAYAGDRNTDNPIASKEHFYCKKVGETNCWAG